MRKIKNQNITKEIRLAKIGYGNLFGRKPPCVENIRTPDFGGYKKPEQTSSFRELLKLSDPLCNRKIDIIQLCLEARAECCKTDRSLYEYAQEIANEESFIEKLLFEKSDKSKISYGLIRLQKLATKLVKDVKFLAFKDKILSKVMNVLLMIVWDKTADMGVRKIFKKSLVEILHAMLPDLKKEKSRRRFDSKLLFEFDSIKQSLRNGLKRSYRNSGAKMQDVNDIIRKSALKELTANKWDKIHQQNNTQITYAILAGQYLASPALIEKSIKKFRRESRELQALGNLFSRSTPK